MDRVLWGAAVVGGVSSCALCAAAAVASAQPSLENLLGAAKSGNATALRAQLLQGVDANGVDEAGATALMYAAIAGHVACVSALLEGGATVDSKDPAGVSPLMLAASRGHTDVCQALLEGGAQLTLKATSGLYKGQTPLDVAIAAFEPAVAAHLLSWAEAHPVDGDIMAPDPLAGQVDDLLETPGVRLQEASATAQTEMALSAATDG
jgi:hypothetical protein